MARVMFSAIVLLQCVGTIAYSQDENEQRRRSYRQPLETVPTWTPKFLPQERYFETAQEKDILTTDCLLMVLDRVQLSAKRDGVIDELFVRMGDNVSQGDLVWEQSKKNALAELNVADARLEQAQIKARNQSGIRAAEVELARATKELSLLEEVKSVPYLERFRAQSTKERTEAELKMAKSTLLEDIYAAKVSKAELAVAELDLKDRSLFAPVSGTVTEQFKYQGEWCKQGEPVLKLIRMDKLMLQGIVNIREITPSQVSGAKVRIEFQIGSESPISFDNLRIEKISPEIDLDGNYVVWTYVKNKLVDSGSGAREWLLRPGIAGTMQILKPESGSYKSSKMTSQGLDFDSKP